MGIKKLTNKQEEAIIEKNLIKFLELKGWYVIKNHQGGRPMMVKGRIVMIPFKNNENGRSDLEAFKDGKVLFVEVKTEQESQAH